MEVDREKTALDRTKARQAFKAYTDNYDASNVSIALKIAHTYRVADIAEQIALSLGLNEEETDFSWLLGLLHDIGRFEQFTQYGTFVDRDSVDHAELGADILFGSDRLIRVFPFPVFSAEVPEAGSWEVVAETCISLHNKLFLPDGLDPTTKLYADILRDADKCDIFRVLTEPPYDKRNERIIAASKDKAAQGASDAVMACVYEHRCVPRTLPSSDFEKLISQCCMGFELNFPESRRIAKRQGYLKKLMSLPVESEIMKDQLQVLACEMRGEPDQ